MKKPWSVVFSLAFLALGVTVTVLGVRDLVRARASAGWASTEAAVRSSEVAKKRHTSWTGRRRRTSIVYSPRVRYEYVVDGRTYTCDCVSFGDHSSSDAARAQKVVNRYPKGTKVTAYYDPEDPRLAVLETGTSWSTYAPLGIGLLFVVIGGLVLLGAIRGRLRHPARGPA